MPQRSKDEDLDEAIRTIKDKVSDHERIGLIHQQVVYMRKDFEEMKENIMYRDTCDAKHDGQDAKIEQLEGRVAKQEQNVIDNSRVSSGTILTIIAVSITIILAIADIAMKFIG
jgi:hypothetical protein